MTPDNIAFDPKGRMWVATDGMNDFDLADGIFGVDTDGPGRGLPKALFCAPTGAEVTGPAFTPDGRTMFVSVQHPAENSETIEKLTTRWPDFEEDSATPGRGGHPARRRRRDRRRLASPRLRASSHTSANGILIVGRRIVSADFEEQATIRGTVHPSASFR